MTKTKLVSLLALVGTAILLTSTAVSQDAAGSITVGDGENDTVTNSNTVTAQGGNVTSADVNVESITQKWAAFYGQLTATERLSDSAGNNFYKWSVDNPTASGSYVYAVQSGVGAPTSLSAVSSPNTFLNTNTAKTLDTGADDAASTFNQSADLDGATGTSAAYTFTSAASGPDATFTSGLAQDGSSNPVYVSNVTQDSTGFAGGSNDFQLLVGVGESTATQDFDFYAKIG